MIDLMGGRMEICDETEETTVCELIDRTRIDFMMAGFEPPVSITVSTKMAEKLQSELDHVIRLSQIGGKLPHNYFLYSGVLIIAPENFIFCR